MIKALSNCRLFAGMSESDILTVVSCSGAKDKLFHGGEMIFYQSEEPRYLHILLDGEVEIGNDSESGRRNIINSFTNGGDMFGEVFLFVGGVYGNYAQAIKDTRVMLLPKAFLYSPCGEICGLHSKIMYNMLNVLASKAYYLNTKLSIISAHTLRHKILRLLTSGAFGGGNGAVKMSREEMADYLGVTRPSLSRELMRMLDEGLIKVDGRNVVIADMAKINKIMQNP